MVGPAGFGAVLFDGRRFGVQGVGDRRVGRQGVGVQGLGVWGLGHRRLGVVLQSALHRSEADARRVIEQGGRIRLVKGAYKEPKTIAHQAKADALVIGIGQSEDRKPVLAPGAEGVDAALKRRLLATLASLGATGKAGDCHRIATFGATAAPVVVAVGPGPAPRRGQAYNAEAIRRGAGAAGGHGASDVDVNVNISPRPARHRGQEKAAGG